MITPFRTVQEVDLTDHKYLFVVGDVHGDLERLLEMSHFLDSVDQDCPIFFVGDLVDRGSHSDLVLNWVMKTYAYCCMGNHEEKHVRWHHNERLRKLFGQRNDMRWNDEFIRTHTQLANKHLEYMASLPTVIKVLTRRGVRLITHAGFTPAYDWQETKTMIRNRNLDNDGKFLHLDMQAAGKHWANWWAGPRVIYGHAVVDQVELYDTYGIDGGCGKGGYLLGYIENLENGEVVYIKVL